MEYKEGYWYKLNGMWYAKFTKIEYNYWYFSECITENKHRNDSSKVAYPFKISTEEVPISEIAQFLPLSHPDLSLIVPKYLKWTANIGCGNSGSMVSRSDFKEGKIFNTSTDKPPFSTVKRTWKEGLVFGWYLSNFTKSSESEYLAQNQPTMKELKSEDMVIGEIYYTEWYGQKDNPFIFEFNSKSECKGLRVATKEFSTNLSMSDRPHKKNFSNLRKATQEEKAKLEAYLTPKKEASIENNNGEFKVGEYAVCKDDVSTYWTANKVFKIGKVESHFLWEGRSASIGIHRCRKAELHEIDISNLNREEILEIAKLYYKPGIRCINNDYNFIVSQKAMYLSQWSDSSDIWNGDSSGRIYDGKWGKILSSNTNEAKNDVWHSLGKTEGNFPDVEYQSEELYIPKAVKKPVNVVLNVGNASFVKINVPTSIKVKKIAKSIKIQPFSLTI